MFACVLGHCFHGNAEFPDHFYSSKFPYKTLAEKYFFNYGI